MSLLTLSRRVYYRRVLSVRPANLIGYWPLWETSGTTIGDYSGNGRNGTYTGVDLGQPGISRYTAPLWDGTNDYGNIYSAGFAAAVGTAEGTMALWIKVSAVGVWSDAAQRRLFHMQADGSNRITIVRSTTNNRIDCSYIAGGTTKTIALTSLTSTDWIHIAMTWSVAGNAQTAYANGVSPGTNTGLGTWAGALSSTGCVLGSLNTTPAGVWSGSLAHAAVWNVALSAGEIAKLARR